MYNLKKLHATLHQNYLEDPEQYQPLFATSLKLNRPLSKLAN